MHAGRGWNRKVANVDLPRPPAVLLYGVGAALTLDEFALWLNLQDVIGCAREEKA